MGPSRERQNYSNNAEIVPDETLFLGLKVVGEIVPNGESIIHGSAAFQALTGRPSINTNTSGVFDIDVLVRDGLGNLQKLPRLLEEGVSRATSGKATVDLALLKQEDANIYFHTYPYPIDYDTLRSVKIDEGIWVADMHTQFLLMMAGGVVKKKQIQRLAYMMGYLSEIKGGREDTRWRLAWELFYNRCNSSPTKTLIRSVATATELAFPGSSKLIEKMHKHYTIRKSAGSGFEESEKHRLTYA